MWTDEKMFRQFSAVQRRASCVGWARTLGALASTSGGDSSLQTVGLAISQWFPHVLKCHMQTTKVGHILASSAAQQALRVTAPTGILCAANESCRLGVLANTVDQYYHVAISKEQVEVCLANNLKLCLDWAQASKQNWVQELSAHWLAGLNTVCNAHADTSLAQRLLQTLQ